MHVRLPGAAWIVALIALRGYDGWGAWAAAPLLLPALLLSILDALVGLTLLVVAARRDRRLDASVAIGTLVSGSVIGFHVLCNLLK